MAKAWVGKEDTPGAAVWGSAMPGPAISLVEASDGISTSKLVCKICKLYFEAKARCMCLSGNGDLNRSVELWIELL